MAVERRDVIERQRVHLAADRDVGERRVVVYPVAKSRPCSPEGFVVEGRDGEALASDTLQRPIPPKQRLEQERQGESNSPERTQRNLTARLRDTRVGHPISTPAAGGGIASGTSRADQTAPDGSVSGRAPGFMPGAPVVGGVYSRAHALLSAALGLAVVAFAPPGASPVLLWLFVVGLGVGIDFDHFLLARLNRGDWANLRRCLAEPTRVVVDQESIFDPGDVWREQRLLSHALLGGVLVAVLWLPARYWALAAAATVYVHVLADLAHDVRTRASDLRQGARPVED